MNLPKFTRGPWQVNDFERSQVCDSDGEKRGCAPIAWTAGTSIAEREANARFIAQCPAMYAELRDIRRLLDSVAFVKTPGDSSRAIARIDAIINQI